MRRLFALALVCGCSSNGTSTKGQHGRDSFSYLASPGCEDGCNLQQYSVAADGAQQQISVSGADFAMAVASAPEVASFVKMGGGVLMTTAMPGDTDLILEDAGGAEVDRVRLHVEAVARLEFTQGWSGAGAVLLENVPITSSPITKRDATSHILLGANAIHWMVSGSLSSLGPTPPSPSTAPASMIESLIVQGVVGSGTLHGDNSGQSFDLPITIVTLNDLSDLTASTGPQVFNGTRGSIDILVQTTISAAAGPVYGAACAWSVSDPSVEITPEDANDQLDHAALGSVTFSLTKAGSYTATCTVGRLMATVMLKRDS